MAKKNTWTYNKSCTITVKETGHTESFATQLYQVGIYVIFNNNASQQGTMTPAQLQKMCKDIKNDSNVTASFGPEITVEKIDGMYVEKVID